MKVFAQRQITDKINRQGNTEEFFQEVVSICAKYNLSYHTAVRWLRLKRIPKQYAQVKKFSIAGKTLREFRKKSLKLSAKQVAILYENAYKQRLSNFTIHMYESDYIPKKRGSCRFYRLVDMYKKMARIETTA